MDIASLAAIRFGLGRTPGRSPSSDPARWLLEQLGGPDAGPGGASVTDAFTAILLDREQRMEQGERGPSRARAIFAAESQALLDHAVDTDTPFRERLVWFWANHFTVSIRRGEVAPLAGAYVREAIRPHVTGRFGDMLLAVMRHPAMLLYLDNAQSAGPNSLAGARQGRGLNENLARECLELHTVCPAAGYSQADVTEFARILTGWSRGAGGCTRGFRFRAGRARARRPRRCWAARSRPGRPAASRRWRSWPTIRPRTATWRPSWCGTSSPTRRRRTRCARSRACCATRDGDLGAAAAALVRLRRLGSR